MCKSVLNGIVLDNIETLKPYRIMKDNDGHIVEDIFQFVLNVITSLPWYFRLPVVILASLIGLLCFLATGQKLNTLSFEKRSSFIKHIHIIPFYRMLNKLIRSMAFLRLFDVLPSTSNYLNSDSCEGS